MQDQPVFIENDAALPRDFRKGSRGTKKFFLENNLVGIQGKIECSICGVEKDISFFEVNRRQCKLCRKERQGVREQNRSEEDLSKIREKRRISCKKWAKENPEKRNAIYARYRKTDKRKEAANKWARKNRKSAIEYRRIRYNSDPLFNITIKIRRRIYMALKTQEKIKGGRTIDLLGCSFEEFNVHIESLFRKGMTWDKVRSGEIQLDHVLPCSSFDLMSREEQEGCFHYTNIQPLWVGENLEKSDHLNWREIFDWAKEVVEIRKKNGLE